MTQTLSGPMLPPREEPVQQLVVLLHGYGSDGNDLIALGQQWRDVLPHALFVAPDAPTACAVNPAGYEWFPLDLEGDRDLARLDGIETARPVLMAFLEALWSQTGLGPQATILAGFSQGAMLALNVGLRLDPPPLGILSFSGALVAPEKLEAELKALPPVALFHGGGDQVVPMAGSFAAEAFLAGRGGDVELTITPGSPHTISPDALEGAIEFLERITLNAS